MREPTIKPYRVSDLRPDSVILGTSRAGVGYDEKHPYFSDKVVYNFSMAGASMYMVYRTFQHALAQGNLQGVLLDLSLVSFNEYHDLVDSSSKNPGIAVFDGEIAVHEDGSQKWFSALHRLTHISRFLLSYSATKDSLATLKKQGEHDGWSLGGRGGWGGSTLRADQSQYQRFMQLQGRILRGFLTETSSERKFSIYARDGSDGKSFHYLERLLVEAQSNGIDVALVISPSHAFFYEALDYLDYEKMYRDWKRRIVNINDDVAKRLGNNPYTVWDYAFYSDLTTEPLPQRSDIGARMTWYFDPVHFKHATGDTVLDQVYLGHDGPGMQITSENLAEKIEAQQESRQQLLLDDSDFLQPLDRMYRRIHSRGARQNDG